jgi:diguanylate cyclase (GGDEF)-like protein/PAS domain S-box-containing protein
MIQEQATHEPADRPRARAGAAGRLSLQNLSITTKLSAIVVSLVLVTLGLLLTVVVTTNVTSGVRAYVGGEGLYSKGQKDAIFYLLRYLYSQSERDYREYLAAIAVPLGDHQARVELQKPRFDREAVARGFIQGGNAAADVPDLIFVFRWFHDVSYMRTAIEAWRLADVQVAALSSCGDQMHRTIAAGQLTPAKAAEYDQQISRINEAITPLEQQFSQVLGEGARQISRLLSGLIFLVAFVLLGGGLFVSWRISRELRIGILNLRRAAKKVAAGDLDQRVEVRSHDELGDLAADFNDMIEHRKGTEAELREVVEFREKIMQSATNAIYAIAPDGTFLIVNRRVCTLTGYSEAELVGMHFNSLFPTERVEELGRLFADLIRTGIPIENHETPLLRKDRQLVLISFSSAVIHKDKKVVAIVGAAEDITERKMHEARLAHLANYDSLTDLPNRNLLGDRIEQALARARRTGHSLALVYLDLDGFKFVNDSYGHTMGDSLLKIVALMLEREVRDDDTVARLGGDEFVILLDEVDSRREVIEVTSRILNAFSQPISMAGHQFHVTASIGVSLYPDDGKSQEALLQYADIAMYSAKNSGRNCVRFFDEEMAHKAERRIEMESAMHTALVRGEFELHYQPQVDLRTGRIDCTEALIRWHHPSYGMMSPMHFVPLAEDTGLIVPIGEWVLRTACRQLGAWHRQGHTHLSVAVNLSPRQFQQQDIPALVGEVLAETGLPAAALHLELTESILLRQSDAVMNALRQLKTLGVMLAIDDFGTGYSSLGYLKRFPVDIIKIDQSFVLDLIANPDVTFIIRAIISMARSLHMKTIAEGVETLEQMEFLADSGCDAIQGFYVSRALPADECLKFIAQRTGGEAADRA